MSELEDFEQELAELQTMSAAYESIAKAGRKEIDELREIINKKVQATNDALVKAEKAKRELRTKSAEVENLKQKKADEEAAKKADEKFANLSREFDALLGNFPWKERALEHQIVGAKRAAIAERAIIGDKPGLGKTLESLMVADLRGVSKIVVVCPPDLDTNFLNEVHKWTNRFAVSIIGLDKTSRDFMLNDVLPKTDEWVLIVSYSTWRRDLGIAEQVNALLPDMVIADEAHYVKSRETKAFKGLKKIVGGTLTCIGCGSPKPPYIPGMGEIKCCDLSEFENSIKQLILMTGTPLVNKPQDLFTLLHLRDPDSFPHERDFLDRYCRQDYYTQRWSFRDGGLDTLSKQMSAFFIARTREDAGIVIPPQETIIHSLDFDKDTYPNQARIIEQLRERAMLILNEKDDFGENIQQPQEYILQLITRQRQAVCCPDGIVFRDKQGVETSRADAKGESQKVDFAENLIKELTDNGSRDENGYIVGERVVLFSQFTWPLDELHKRLTAAGISSVVFNGNTSNALADKVKFDVDIEHTVPKSSKYQVVLAHYRKGGVGLNMTGITQMVILDDPWNPATMDQATGRIDRMGQTKETCVHRIVMKKSIDDWMIAINEEKKNLVDGFESNVNLQAAMLDALMNGDI